VTVKPALPYHSDPDYRQEFVSCVGLFAQNLVVDTLESYGYVEVLIRRDQMEELSRMPLVGEVRSAIDREMRLR